eukprot:1437690-Amphidinium_carterae.1
MVADLTMLVESDVEQALGRAMTAVQWREFLNVVRESSIEVDMVEKSALWCFSKECTPGAYDRYYDFDDSRRFLECGSAQLQQEDLESEGESQSVIHGRHHRYTAQYWEVQGNTHANIQYGYAGKAKRLKMSIASEHPWRSAVWLRRE